MALQDVRYGTNVDLQGYQLKNHRLELLGADPGFPNTGDIWYRTGDNDAKIFDGTANRKLFVDDDDFNSLAAVTIAQNTDTILIADASDSFNYKKMTRANFLSGLSLVLNAYYRVTAQTGTANLDASGAAAISISGDGTILESFGATGPNVLTIRPKSQSANRVFAGPAAGGPVTPTFRALVAADMPSGYNNSNWDTAYTHSQAITGNPHSVTAVQASAEPALGNPASSGYVLSSTVGGTRSWIASVVSFGASNQIPHMNTGGTDFDYDANFTWTGSLLRCGQAMSNNIQFITATGITHTREATTNAFLNINHSNTAGHSATTVTSTRRGGTIASPVIIPTDAYIMQYLYTAHDGVSDISAGEFRFQVDGAVAAGDFDTKFVWKLKNGASSSAEMMVLKSSGILQIDHLTEFNNNAGVIIEGTKLEDNTLVSDVADGGSAIAFGMSSENALYNATAKLLSVKNYTAERFHILATGDAWGYGMRLIKHLTITHSDDGSPVTIITLPVGAVIHNFEVYVRVAFDSADPELDIGNDAHTGVYYLNTHALSGTGFQTLSLLNLKDRMLGTEVISVQYDDNAADGTEGTLNVYVEYSIHNEA